MIIKPYIKQHKLSELKIGDKVRFVKLLSSSFKEWSEKLVTIDRRNTRSGNFILLKEIPHANFHFSYFEIEDDRKFILDKK